MQELNAGVTARAAKKVLKQAKGYYGARSRVFRVAKQAVIKAVSTHTATVAESAVPCSGLHVLMPERVNAV